MSVSYIDLSSDEEVEIITEKTISNKPIAHNAGYNNDKLLPSAVERLQRNSSIEITIDIDQNDIKKVPEHSQDIPPDAISITQLLYNEEPSVKENKMPPQKKSNFSSDIIVLDNDEQEPIDVQKANSKSGTPVQLVKEKSSYSIMCRYSKKDVLKPNNSRRTSNAEQLQSSKVVVANDNEILIIDDDDDVVIMSEPKAQLNNLMKLQNSEDASKEEKKKLIMSVKKSPKKLPVLSPTVSTASMPASPANTTTTTALTTHTSLSPALPVPVVLLPRKLALNSSAPIRKSCPSILDDVVILDEPEPTKQLNKRELRPRTRPSDAERNTLTSKQSSQHAVKSSPKATSNGISSTPSGQSTSKMLLPKVDLTRLGIDCTSQSAINKYSVENMFDGLVKISCKIFQDENLGTRFWRYFRAASEEMLKSEQFLKSLKVALKSAEDVKNPTLQDKQNISRHLKEVIKILKRQPERVNKTLRKLNKMLQLVNDRIKKLEEMEVTSSSDEDSENVYVLLDRHRIRAAKIYSKICELEGKAAHAGRARLQKFHFSGTSGYAKIEHALEKYFDKTRQFPDFQEVKRLIGLTVEREKIQILPIDIHNIAQSMFLEFGNKLQRMRKCDDYTILVDYLEDGEKDPALDDEDLHRKLQENKNMRKKEEDVLAEYTKKQVDLRVKGEIKSDEEDTCDNDCSTEDDESCLEGGGSGKKDLQFSDTEDELINDNVETISRKRKPSTDEDNSSQKPFKRTMSDLDQMEVNLKLVTDVQEGSGVGSESSSADKDLIMDQLGLTSKGKKRRV